MGKYSHVRVEKVPYARDLLLEVSRRLRQTGRYNEAVEIHEIVHDLMWRDYKSAGKRTAKPKQVKITSQVVRNVLADLATNPAGHYRHIGRRHGIDGGRVSEIASGLRTPQDPGMIRHTRKRK